MFLLATSGREVARGCYEGAGGGRVAGLPTCAVVFCTVGERAGRGSNSFYRDKNKQVNIGVSDLSGLWRRENPQEVIP